MLSLMTAIFGGSIKTLAGSELFTLGVCAVLSNGRVPSLGSNMITTLPRLISFDQNDYPKQRRGPKLGRTRQPFAQLNALEYVVVCLVFAVFPSRATTPNASKHQLDQVIPPRVVVGHPFTTPVPNLPPYLYNALMCDSKCSPLAEASGFAV